MPRYCNRRSWPSMMRDRLERMRIVRTGFLMAVAAMASLPALVPEASAQAAASKAYPVKTIRMVLPFPPGGATDIMARRIGQKLSERWGQQVLIENRAGAGGNIATELVAKAAPDGYTLLFAASAQLAVNPSLYGKVPFDPVKSFAPVTLVGSVPNILVAHPSLPVRSLKEFIAFAKARPGQLNYGSSGNGSSIHLATELFKMAAKVDIVQNAIDLARSLGIAVPKVAILSAVEREKALVVLEDVASFGLAEPGEQIDLGVAMRQQGSCTGGDHRCAPAACDGDAIALRCRLAS